MIEEKIADRIEGIFEQKQLGHISSDHAREQLIKQLMYLTQAQREACAERYESYASAYDSYSPAVKKVILNEEVQE